MLLLLLLLTVTSPQVRWGWGDVAVMQVVADLSPPYCTPPVTQGGEGGSNALPTRTVADPEPQPLARKVGWGLGEGWLGTGRRLAGDWEKVGWGLGQGWLGTGRRLAGDWGRLAGDWMEIG